MNDQTAHVSGSGREGYRVGEGGRGGGGGGRENMPHKCQKAETG